MSSQPDPILAFVEALLVHGGLLRQVFDHMQAFSDAGMSDDDAPPADVVLRNLIGLTLDGRLDDIPDDDLITATRVIERSIVAIETDLVLVPVETFPRRPSRALRRSRGGCR